MNETAKLSTQLWANSEMSQLAKRSFFATMEESAAGTLATDRNGTIVWINQRYCSLLGFDSAAIIGRPVASVLPGTRIPEVLQSGLPIVLDVMPHGGRDYLVSRFPVFDDDHNIIGAFGFVLNNPQDEVVRGKDPMSGRLAYSHAERRLLSRPAQLSDEFAGTSSQAQRVRLLAKKCAGSRAPVLITGPTGSGKEIIARMIHHNSRQRDDNFVAVNVGAIPETLFEAEFFGSVSGAYTGADKRGRVGKLQLADGGTLFLDELGDMPLGAQVKLLRFLETAEFEPLGSNQLRRAEVRLVAATSVDLAEAVRQKKFRADLYYRLAVFPIAVPPLHEHADDIPELCEKLLEQIDRVNGFRTTLLPDALTSLQSRQWPGNVRELRNLLERCAIFADGEPIDAPLIEAMTDQLSPVSPTQMNESSLGQRSLPQAVEALEAQEIALALAACQGSAASAARHLGISRTTLYKKAKQFGYQVG